MARALVPYDPWRAVDDRTDVILAWSPVARLMGGGFTVRREGWTIIALDPELPPVERRAALTHELVHDERGGVHDGGSATSGWGAVVTREERAVDREVVRRLAPTPLLREAVDRLVRAEGAVTARSLADDLELPERLAELALADLRAGRGVAG